MFSPILDRYRNEIMCMTLDELKNDLYYFENPTTTNRITLAVMENKAEIVRERIAEIEKEKEN